MTGEDLRRYGRMLVVDVLFLLCLVYRTARYVLNGNGIAAID